MSEKTPRTLRWTLFAGLAAVIVFAALAGYLYRRTQEQVVRDFEGQQLALVRQTAAAVEMRWEDLRHRLDRVGLGQQAGRRVSDLEEFETLFQISEEGRLDVLRGSLAPAVAAVIFGHKNEPGTYLSDPFFGEDGSVKLAVLEPMFEKGRKAGAAGGIFALSGLLGPPLRGVQGTPASVVIVDENGSVLANTHHPDMIGRQIPAEGSCLPCHRNFAIEQRMLRGEEGAGKIQVAKNPVGVVAFTPLRLANRHWSLGFSTQHGLIAQTTRSGFMNLFVLLALFLSLTLAATVFMFRLNQKRRLAEMKAQAAERRLKFEQQLQHAEQLAAVGKMASHIAHEINTPLASIGLNVDYLRTEVERCAGEKIPQIDEVSGAITREIDRLKKVIQDYLRFARVQKPAPERRSLGQILQNFLDFIAKEAEQRSVKILPRITPEPTYASLDENLVRQALLNIVRNSFEAMPDGGEVRIELRAMDGDLELRISDNGPGITAEHLPRIFDPFFTTKREGTGLGLAYTRKIVREHGGDVRCETRPGSGTTFVITLPRTTGERVTVPARGEPAPGESAQPAAEPAPPTAGPTAVGSPSAALHLGHGGGGRSS
jgi:signal transduction histidine kinase